MHAHLLPFQRTNSIFICTGSKEKAELKKALSELKSKVRVPLYINGQEILTDSKDTVVCPHNPLTCLLKLVKQAKNTQL